MIKKIDDKSVYYPRIYTFNTTMSYHSKKIDDGPKSGPPKSKKAIKQAKIEAILKKSSLRQESVADDVSIKDTPFKEVPRKEPSPKEPSPKEPSPKEPSPKEPNEPQKTICQHVDQENICVFSLAGTCKGQCRGKKEHPDANYPNLRLFQKIVKSPWFLPEFQTSLNDIMEEIKKQAFPELPDIRPFIKTCIYSVIGQKQCENWREHRLVEMPIIFNGQKVKILVCHNNPVDWNIDDGKTEKRVFCGLHFDISFIIQKKGIKMEQMIATNRPHAFNAVAKPKQRKGTAFDDIGFKTSSTMGFKKVVFNPMKLSQSSGVEPETEMEQPDVGDSSAFPTLSEDVSEPSLIPKEETEWDKRNYVEKRKRLLLKLDEVKSQLVLAQSKEPTTTTVPTATSATPATVTPLSSQVTIEGQPSYLELLEEYQKVCGYYDELTVKFNESNDAVLHWKDRANYFEEKYNAIISPQNLLIPKVSKAKPIRINPDTGRVINTPFALKNEGYLEEEDEDEKYDLLVKSNGW